MLSGSPRRAEPGCGLRPRRAPRRASRGLVASRLAASARGRPSRGHAWSAQTLLDAEKQAVEAAVYNAASKLMEIAAVHRRLAELARAGGGEGGPAEHLRAAEAAEQRAEQVRRLAADDPASD